MRTSPAFLEWSPPPVAPVDSEDLWLWQAKRCAACGTTVAHLCLDHDHRTYLVRGWLCRRCNNQEGQTGAHPYLSPWRAGVNPATHFGVVEEYVGRRSVGEQILDTLMPEPTLDELRDAINQLPSSA